jgi:hypothetical protein
MPINLNRLRMQGIFGGAPGGRQVSLPGPDFSNLFGNKGLDVTFPDYGELSRQDRIERDEIRRQENVDKPWLAGTGSGRSTSMSMPTEERQPKNVVFNPNYEKQKIELQREALRLRGEQQEAEAAQDIRQSSVAKQRADVYEYMALNPEMRLITPKGGNVIAFNPRDGSMMDLGIPTGTLKEEDLERMKQSYELEKTEKTEGMRTEREKELEGVRQTGRESLEGMRQRGRERIEDIRQRNERGELPTQTRVRIANRARELAAKNPNLSDYITVDPGSNAVTIKKPGRFMGMETGPSQEEYNSIVDSLYGEETGEETKPSSGNWIRVMVDGEEQEFNGTPEEAEEAGYEVIGR